MAILNLPKQVLVGEGTFEQLPNFIQQLQIERVFVIYSGSALKSRIQTIQQQLTDAEFYKMPKGEPTLDVLAHALQRIQQAKCDGIVAIGGGSAIDLAKAVAAKACNPQIELLQFAKLGSFKRLPIIVVPTTAGTGSEATKVTVITDTSKGVKLNPSHRDFIPDVAILDPTLTIDVPKDITAFTSLDALTHAIEAYVSTNATALSDFYAMEAVKLITNNIKVVYYEPTNVMARQHMLLGSYYAGIAFSNASTNLAHATGRALGAKFLLPHGQSVALMHPFVVEYSMASCKNRYEHIAHIMGLQTAEMVSGYLHRLTDELDVWASARNIVDLLSDETIAEMTNNALNGNGIVTNRQVPTERDITKLYALLRKRLQSKGDF